MHVFTFPFSILEIWLINSTAQFYLIPDYTLFVFDNKIYALLPSLFQADMTSPSTPILRNESPNGTMVGRLLGFLRPPLEWEEELSVCVSYCNTTLRIGNDISTFNAQQKNCHTMNWPEKEKSNRILIDFMARKTVNIGAYNAHQLVSSMQLKHKENDREPAKVGFLEIYYLKLFCFEVNNKK